MENSANKLRDQHWTFPFSPAFGPGDTGRDVHINFSSHARMDKWTNWSRYSPLYRRNEVQLAEGDRSGRHSTLFEVSEDFPKFAHP
jgi:hypothetical protein